jgi:hypothetical protein
MGAIFREENSWLEEWIRYHRALGVEHFILYNDDPDTHVSDRILKPYVDQGLLDNIHVHECPEDIRNDIGVRQQNVYREMIGNMAGRTRWLAILDLDEFILPRCQDDIRTILEEYEEHSGLAINWAIYGSSGHVTRPPNQINHFLHRGETNWEPNQYVKSIIKPERVLLDKPNNVHCFPTSNGDTVNENHEPVTGMRHAVSTGKIRINHYVVRSWQDFWEIKVRRPRFCYLPPCDAAYFEYHDRNEVFDDEIFRRFGHIARDLH